MPETETPMQCRHVFTDGRRCAAACLRHEPFCYYHHTTRRPVQNLPARRRRSSTFTLPELEDRAAVQLALAEVLQRIASNDIDPKRAGHLLFGLQIATMLLPKRDPKDKTQPRTVSEITHDEELGDLAPAQAVGTDREPDPWDAILDSLDEMDSQDVSAPKPFDLDTLPSLDAAAEEPDPVRSPNVSYARSSSASSSSTSFKNQSANSSHLPPIPRASTLVATRCRPTSSHSSTPSPRTPAPSSSPSDSPSRTTPSRPSSTPA